MISEKEADKGAGIPLADIHEMHRRQIWQKKDGLSQAGLQIAMI